MKVYYALYDINDRCIGTFDREQLKKKINTSNKSFICILSRLNTKHRKKIIIDGEMYRVYIYKEDKNDGKS